ncbi:MAG TPA: isocitrate lyase/phosphoenolpyruvate mutase family protein [Acidimicrobiales bacterium]|nr:isocitrate lyase/phosphoenolpyruvate mutase family protein [Acidimicrobiales bacterium]
MKAAALRALHAGPALLVLPNAWDAASARAVEKAGFPAVATSSGAVARTLGWDDGEAMPVEEALAAVARIARAVDVPVTADVEGGYGLSPAELAERLLAAGAVGCNYEDTDHGGDDVLVPAERQAERIAALRAAAGDNLVINARVDTYVHGIDDYDETVRRARLYLEAGADCVYPITLAEEAAIGALVRDLQAPVNVYVRPQAPSLARLAELGVRRASFGSGLFRTTHTALKEALAGLRT